MELTIKQMVEKFEEKGYSITKRPEESSEMGFSYLIDNRGRDFTNINYDDIKDLFAELEYGNEKKKPGFWDLIVYSKYAWLKLKSEDLLIGTHNWCWFEEGFNHAEKQLDEMETKITLRN